MRAVGVILLLLVGCGVQPRNSGDTDEVSPPPVVVSDGLPICASIATPGMPMFKASACAMPAPGPIAVVTMTSIDTDLGTSKPPGLTCAHVGNGTAKLCVIAAPAITVDAGITLSAHGSVPLAIFAHSISILGTVDVASHAGGSVGAAALLDGCLTGSLPRLAGGGHGGGASGVGGQGGDQGGTSSTGGAGGFTFAVTGLVGGCGGTRGGDGSPGGQSDGGATTGGAGGGAVWIVSDRDKLFIDSGAAINASGAGGSGGAAEGHGGAGGGAGGLIVLQAPTIQLDPGGAVFANGGHGGGGAGANAAKPGFTAGAAGTDSTGPASGGSGGGGGTDGADTGTPAGGGSGGAGYPGANRRGQDGGQAGHGGGGGGGGEGAIRVVSGTRLTGPNVSPPAVQLP